MPEPATAVAVPRARTRRDPAHELGCEVAGALRVVVRDGRSEDLGAVTRDAGPPSALAAETPIRMPRLEISFVDHLATSALRLLDGGSVGYAGSGLYTLAASGSPESCIEQGTAWGSGSIVCTRGLRKIPFLSAAIDLAALRGELAPLHASAWVTPEGVGVIASGWAHSGKTGALLAACEHGARPIGDDRVLLSTDGSRMLGCGGLVEAKDWHVAQLPRLRSTLGSSRGILAKAGYALASRRAGGGRSGWGRLFDRALTKARSYTNVEIDLSSGEGAEARSSARPQVLLLMEMHDDDRIVAEPADPDSVATRLAAHARAEMLAVLRAQLAYEYAHPGGGWRNVEEAPRMTAEILERAVRGISAWIVRHPYPCSLERLHEVTSEIAGSVR